MNAPVRWQVIYGDTDSIMVYSGLDDIAKAKAMAGRVIQEVSLLEISRGLPALVVWF